MEGEAVGLRVGRRHRFVATGGLGPRLADRCQRQRQRQGKQQRRGSGRLGCFARAIDAGPT